eukprot:5459597-Pyramimonas_sp.AAC.1
MYTRGDFTSCMRSSLDPLPQGRIVSGMNKRKVVEQPKKRPNAKARKKYSNILSNNKPSMSNNNVNIETAAVLRQL